jgi:hypothetical protein
VCAHYFNLGIHETAAVGESILTQTICRASMRQHETSAFKVPTTLFFFRMVGEHFTPRLRNLDSRLQIKERAVECRDVFFDEVLQEHPKY